MKDCRFHYNIVEVAQVYTLKWDVSSKRAHESLFFYQNTSTMTKPLPIIVHTWFYLYSSHLIFPKILSVNILLGILNLIWSLKGTLTVRCYVSEFYQSKKKRNKQTKMSFFNQTRDRKAKSLGGQILQV